MAQIKFQDVLRDAVQSLFGANPSAQEIIDSYPTAHLTGTHAIQTGGETFFDLFAKKRRRNEGRSDWSIPFRSDHGQEILDDLDRNTQPGYPSIGRLKGLAELRGVIAGLQYGRILEQSG